MRTKKIGLVLSLLLVLFAGSMPLFAQSDWYYNKPIKNISFRGLENVKAADLDGITAPFINRLFTESVFSDLLNRVYDLDYFTDVEPQALPGDADKNSVNIVFVVKERPVVSKVEFKGYNQIHLSELREAVSIKEKDLFIPSKVLLDTRAITYLYTEKGFATIKVNGTYEETEKGVVVTYTIEEGKQTIVKSINFEGNTVVSARTLKGKINLKEAGFINKGSFQEALLDQDCLIITSYYQDRGYVDARIVDVVKDVEYNEEKHREEVTITFIIQEGVQYTFGGIVFEGNNVFTTEQLQELVKQDAGEIYNQTKIRESFAAIQNLYYENGYMTNQFAPRMNKDAENKVISFNFYIGESVRSHVENIVIKGNSKTKEEVIRREIPIEEGDIFSNTKIYTALRSLYNLQYFTDVQPEILPGSEDNLVDIVFTVEEKSTTNLNFGFVFSGVSNPDEFPIALQLTLQDSNLFGNGISIGADTRLATEEQSITLSYGQNWMFDLPIASQFSFGYSHQNLYDVVNRFMPDGTIDGSDYYMEYQQHEISLGLSGGYRWALDFATLTASGGFTSSIVNNVYDGGIYFPVDSTISDYNNAWEPKNSLWLSFSADGRDVAFESSEGWFVSERLGWNGLFPKGMLPFAPEWGESQFFLRSDFKTEMYHTLCDVPVTENWNFKLVFMTYSGVSMQLPVGTPIKPSNQIYIDGLFYGKGWSVYNTARGQALMVNSFELRMPIVPGVLAGDLFFDACMLKQDIPSMFTDMFNGNDWYFSFGPSLKFEIQQFPLRLIFASQFKIDENGFVWKDQFGNSVNNFLESFHFVLSINVPNR